VLEAYLPAALGADDLAAIVAAEIDAAAADGATGMKAMGRVVAAVRAKAGPTADGALIAAQVKAALSTSAGSNRLRSVASHCHCGP
jgi:uncharacterized protein YqeY